MLIDVNILPSIIVSCWYSAIVVRVLCMGKCGVCEKRKRERKEEKKREKKRDIILIIIWFFLLLFVFLLQKSIITQGYYTFPCTHTHTQKKKKVIGVYHGTR